MLGIVDKPFNIKIQPTIKQGACWKKLRDNTTQFILFGGGVSGGKSWIGCEWLLLNCIMYPGTKWFVGRNELKRIMKSTYITFQKVCKWHKIPDSAWKLNSQYNYIKFWNGSRIDLIDVAYKPIDPLYERFGSEEYTSGWLEEAGEIKEKAFDVLKSRIGRHLNDKFNIFPKMFLTCNPKKNWIYFDFYRPFKENNLPDDRCFIQSLHNDNPYNPASYEGMLEKIRDPIMKARLKEGHWEYEDDGSSLMDYTKILRMFDRLLDDDINGEFYLSIDVARFGRDKAVITLWQGYFIRRIWYYDKSSSTFLEDKIRSKCKQWHIPFENVIVDSDGIGGPLCDRLPGVVSFVNGGRPVEAFDDDKKYRLQETDKYNFKNLKAQCYFKLADLVNEGKIGCYKDIDPEIRNWVIQELEAIRRKEPEANEKKIQVIGKEEIRDAIGRSPDFADSLMMRCFFGLGSASEMEGFGEVDIAW